jgi:flagellar biosynthesis GTPase FlhF
MASFAHVAPDGTEQPFSDADNQIIAEARARGLPTVRINDVVTSSGAVLQFEVRFGTAARSERMVQVPPTGMCQVNLINGNTRVVRELQLGDATLSPQASAPPAYRGPSPSVHRPPAPSHWQSSTRLVQPVGAPPVYHAPSLAPQATGPTYGHEGPDGTCTPFSDADNHAIASAITRGDSTIRTNDIVLPNGSILQFEVRFGAAAVSMRMPKPPASGMIQVNLANENTRVVRQIGGQPAKSAVTSVVPIDTAPSIRAPLGTAPSMPAPNLADERKKRDALAVLNGATKMLLCDPTGKSKHDRFFWVEEDPSSKARICWSAKSKDEHSVGGGMFSREVKVKKETLMSITSFVPVVDESSRGCAFQMGTDKTQLVVLAPDETTKETWVFGCQLVLKEEEAIRDRLERDRLAAQKASAAAAKQDADQMKSKARREMQKAKADADVAIADANAEAQNLAEAQRAMKAEAEESRQTLEQISNLRTLPPAVVLCKAHGVNPLLPQLSDELHRLVHQEVIVWGCECSHGWDVSGRSGTVGEIEPVQKGNIVVYLQPASDCSGGHHSGSGDGAGAPADSELVAKLQEMGFSQSHARAAAAAISRTGESVDQSVQNAMEWCLQHPDASDSMASITGHGEMIELPREQVIPARHEPVLLDAVKKALRNHFMARYIGPAAGGGLVLVDPKNCVVCGKVFRHLNDGVECTSDHFTCNTCLCRVASDSSGVVCCPVARAGCMAAPFDDVTIARHVDQTTFEALEARRQSVANAGGKWLTEPEDLGNGVYKYSLTHAGVGVSNSLDAHHFGLAFTQYGALLQSSAKKVTLVEYYENPGLRTKFEATRQRFELAGKDDKAVWIFHGSKKENIPKIMEGGFKVSSPANCRNAPSPI